MDHLSPLLIAVLFAGLAFDFVNGFHDAANAIATIVATRVLTPRQAVAWAAFFNITALFVFGTGVAATVGSGLVDLTYVTPQVVLSGLIGATLWGLMTWRLGLPSSSSHALLGGYAGAAMAGSVAHTGWGAAFAPILWAGWIKVTLFIVLAPVMGLGLAFFLMSLHERYAILRAHEPVYRRIQLLSSAFLSLMHGGNDAQKTAGIIASALTSGGVFASFHVPFWVLGISYTTIGLGTLLGGWRIVRTLGHRLTHLTPAGGVCAEGSAALALLGATLAGLPVSTTHVTTGAILGVGAASQPRRVKWHIGRRIAWAWLITIPASALVGAGISLLLQ